MAIAPVPIVLLAQIRGWSTACMSGDIDLKSPCRGVLARCVQCAPVCLAAMDGVIAMRAEYLHKRLAGIGPPDSRHRRDAVIVPLGRYERAVGTVGGLVALQGPVGHTVARRVATRHQTATAGRTDGRSVSLRKTHALSGQPLHIRGLIQSVEPGFGFCKRHRGILPPHVIHQEKDDIGRLVRHCLRRQGQHRCHRSHLPSFVHVFSSLLYIDT